MILIFIKILVKDTHKENTLSNKTQAPSKTINIDIWIIGTSNQLFIRGCYTKIKFPKKK